MQYNERPLTFDETIQQKLIAKDLIVRDKDFAINALENIGYYRLGAYFPPFQDKQEVFKSGTTFEDILQLYEFDEKLRLIFMGIIECIEVSFRVRITYYLAHRENFGLFGHTETSHFKDAALHKEWLSRAEDDVKRSRKSFRSEYPKHEDVLPLWMLMEVISFGQLSQFYKLLRKDYGQEIGQKYYGVSAQVLASWLQSLTFIRNICAHHHRLWNISFAVAPKIPKGGEGWVAKNEKIFNIIMVFKNTVFQAGRWAKFVGDLSSLVSANPKVNVKSMGFPDNWLNNIMKAETLTPSNSTQRPQ